MHCFRNTIICAKYVYNLWMYILFPLQGNVVHRGLKVADIAEMTKLTVFNDVEVTPAQLDHTLPQKAFGEALSVGLPQCSCTNC